MSEWEAVRGETMLKVVRQIGYVGGDEEGRACERS